MLEQLGPAQRAVAAQLLDDRPTPSKRRYRREPSGGEVAAGDRDPLTDLRPSAPEQSLVGEYVPGAHPVQVPHPGPGRKAKPTVQGKWAGEDGVLAGSQLIREASGALERAATHEQATRGRMLERSRPRRHPLQELENVGGCTPAAGFGAVEDCAGHEVEFLDERVLELSEPVWIGYGVGIEERNQFSAGARRSDIASRAWKRPLPQRDLGDPGLIRRRSRASGGLALRDRTIRALDHEHLVLVRVDLWPQRVKHHWQGASRPVGRDDHAHSGHPLIHVKAGTAASRKRRAVLIGRLDCAPVVRASNRSGAPAGPASGQLRLGIIGCGLVVERGHLPALEGISELRLTAVCDPMPERRRAAPGVRAYADLEEMLAGERLDAVLVSSPPELHLEHAEACSRRRIPTLVEKPPGTSTDEAARLASLQPEPFIGFNRRFAAGLPVGTRAIADPVRVTAIFDAPPSDWGGIPPEPLLDLGCHLVDLARMVSGQWPVRARSLPAESGRAEFELAMSGGARLLASCGAAVRYREILDVRGLGGEARSWRWPEPVGRQIGSRLSRRAGGLVGSWRAQLRALAAAVRGDSAGPLARAGEAVEVMAALDAVRESAHNGHGWITVETPAPQH